MGNQMNNEEEKKVSTTYVKKSEFDKIRAKNKKLKEDNEGYRQVIFTLEKELETKKRKISQITKEKQMIGDIFEKKYLKKTESEPSTKNQEGEPPLKKPKINYVIALTGFKGEDHFFNLKLKKKMIEAISSLGGIVYRGNDISECTHVIAPPRSRTVRVLDGILKHKQIVGVQWIFDSEKKGEFVDSSEYGFRRLENPIEGKTFHISRSFEHSLKGNTFTNCLDILKLGGGKICSSPRDSCFVLVGQEDIGERKYFISHFPKTYVISFAELVDIIYPNYLDRTLFVTKERY